MSERFDVTTVGGFLRPIVGKTTQARGLSAHVIDRAYNCKVVATYRSEDRRVKRFESRARLGVDGALFHARQHAALLNELDV